MGEVDYLLDRLEAAVSKGQPLTPIIEATTLSEVRLREGYEIAEVDAFLATLRDRDADPAPALAAEQSVVTEQRGLFARLFGRR